MEESFHWSYFLVWQRSVTAFHPGQSFKPHQQEFWEVNPEQHRRIRHGATRNYNLLVRFQITTFNHIVTSQSFDWYNTTFNNKKITGITPFDARNAFDKVWHIKLIANARFRERAQGCISAPRYRWQRCLRETVWVQSSTALTAARDSDGGWGNQKQYFVLALKVRLN